MGRGAVVVLAAVVAAAFVPVSGAGRTASSVALMPLPAGLLGEQAAHLVIDPDSGSVSNVAAANDATRPTSAARLAQLGRLAGYRLDFHDPTSAALVRGHGLLRVTTEVDRYRSPAAAGAGLAFDRTDALASAQLGSALLTVAVHPFAPAGIGPESFGLSSTITPSGKGSAYETDLAFRDGAYVGTVSVSAAEPAGVKGLAVALGSRLRRRMDAVLNGKVSGPPVPLPPRVAAGPPPHGPDLSKLALRPSDVGSGTVSHEGYQVDRDLEPISEYERHMEPGGAFPILDSEVALFHSAAEASYAASFALGGFGSPTEVKWVFGSSIAGVPVASVSSKSVPVSGGDEAQAVVVTIELADGHRVDIGFSAVRVGSTVDLVTLFSPIGKPLAARALRSVVKVAASRLAGHPGGPVA